MSRLVRSRWAAVVVMAVAIGTAGVGLIARAAGTSAPSSFVPIAPCRLMDTRGPDNVGPRATALGAGEIYSTQVTGANGQCTIPTNATGVSMNVVAVLPSANSFLSVFPADQAWPGTSNLNWLAGQAPTPNAVTATLSVDGRLAFYNPFGTVHVVADIVGYYEPSTAGPKGDTGAPGPVSARCAATQRWDLTTCQRATISSGGNGPFRIASDGTSLWVTNSGSNTVSRINPATGAQSTYTTGSGPRGVAFDGRYIWVANSSGGSVSRIDPAQSAPGTPVDYPAGNYPGSIAFDGRYLWVTNFGSGDVTRIDPTQPPGSPVNYAAGDTPQALAYDGTYIWVTNENSNSITRILATSVAPGTSATYTGVTRPIGIAFDGTNIWVTSYTTGKVLTMNAAAAAPGSWTAYNVGTNPVAVAFDGSNIWVSNYTTPGTVSKIDPHGTVPGTPLNQPVGANPWGLAYDGTNIWVANASSPGTITRLVP